MIRSGVQISKLFWRKPVSFHSLNKGVRLAQEVRAPAPLAFQSRFYFSKKKVVVPKMGDSITDGVVFQITKNVGDYVELDEVVAIIETDKIKVDLRSTDAGVLSQLYAKEGDTVQVGKDFLEVDTTAAKPEGKAAPAEKKPAAAQPAQQQAQPQQQQQPQQQAQPQPQQQTAAKEEPSKAAPKAAESKPKPASTIGASGVKSRGERKETMNRMRQRIAQRLKEAQNTAAMLTTFQEVDMSTVIELRNTYKDEFQKKQNAKLGFMSFFVKASVAALREQPIVNAYINGNEIIYRDYVDISVAVATPTGLIVPVLRNCESLSFADIERNLEELGKKGKEGKITAEDMAGGTFTISNGGVFGSLMGTPILNPPQSAILGMHAIVNRPVVRGEQIVARPMMYLALTYDHRLIDGREAVTFLKKIQLVLEDPRRLLLDI
eukprot:TRINITY_DN540_c0_g1_i1.p1 TRINITY_DN540_c0_g1~~TRINITY_DN540_c0_g1_i1.p1  ORF type:complete len:434 (-),score=166.51 TRINITY_DN540_c0_g1_i1:682-1983(-)